MNAPAPEADGRVRVIEGDCVKVAARLAAEGVLVDAVVCDPPYHLTSIVKRFGADGAAAVEDRNGIYARASRGFMGQKWDGGDVAFRAATWAALGRLVKPGGYLIAFSGPRTYHRMASAIEDAGFDVRDMIAWLYATGFPKSDDVERAIARRLCRLSGRHYEHNLPPESRRREGDHVCPPTPESLGWRGWGTALKPALEPICFARKPPIGSVAENVLMHRTGGLHIDACRIAPCSPGDYAYAPGDHGIAGRACRSGFSLGAGRLSDKGRWPANVVLDGSAEAVTAFPESEGQQSAVSGFEPSRDAFSGAVKFGGGLQRQSFAPRGDGGSAARFFFSAKADAIDRLGSKHPTVKPLDLMRWLIRLAVPKGALVLDPFAGTGTTGVAALAEDCRAILIEREPEFVADIRARLAHAAGEGPHSETLKARGREPSSPGPLFDCGGKP